MGKSKNNTTDLIDNPFGAFKILKGEFAPPSDEDDIQDGEEGILKEEPNDLTETSVIESSVIVPVIVNASVSSSIVSSPEFTIFIFA